MNVTTARFKALCAARNINPKLINYRYGKKDEGQVTAFLNIKSHKGDSAVIEGDFFIVPNPTEPCVEDGEIGIHISEFHNKLDIDYIPGEPLVQIWCTNHSEVVLGVETSENWQDHGVALSEKYSVRFNSWIPVRLVKDLKEGETLELNRCDGQQVIRLTARQLKYRYRRFGKFEETLSHCIASARV